MPILHGEGPGFDPQNLENESFVMERRDATSPLLTVQFMVSYFTALRMGLARVQSL